MATSTRFAQKYGPWALVTGASSGLGREFARELAARGLHLVLVARRADAMEELARELANAHGTECRVVALDLGRDDIDAVLAAATAGLEIGLLANNAGFGNTGNLLDNDLAAELALLHVNCRAPLVLAHRYGRAMRERGRGGIVFTSSMAAFAACPTWANYAASKSYDLLLAEALALELAASGVDVVALCPGATRTGFQEVAAIDVAKMPGSSMFLAEPAPVVRAALDALGHRTVVVPGAGNAAQAVAMRFLPRAVAARIVGSIIGSMATGH